MGNQIDSLLQEIQQAVLCPYLSDLHSYGIQFDQRAKHLITNIPDDRYTLKEWNDAASYITGTTCNFSTVKEAKKKISKIG